MEIRKDLGEMFNYDVKVPVTKITPFSGFPVLRNVKRDARLRLRFRERRVCPTREDTVFNFFYFFYFP